MIDAKRIEEMKRLSAEATPGPWVAQILSEWKVDICGKGRFVIEDDEKLLGEDVGFIAESRQFVPDIIAAYEAQAEENERLSDANSDLRGITIEMAEEIAELRKTLIDIYEYTSDLTIVQTITRRHHDIPLEAE